MGYYDNYAKSKKTKSTYYSEYARSVLPQNRGGVGAGIGYTFGKVGTGAVGILEGIWDYTAGGLAKLFGADDWAEEQFANNITGDLNSGLDDWYNPSKGWQVAGDVAGGIGNSLVGMAVVGGASLISGGALAPAAAKVMAGVTIGLGAAGMSTAEAYGKTGELGAKEFGYGAISGVTEAALESVSGAAGDVSAKLFAKKTAKTIAKKSVLKGLVKNFAEEAFEEGMSEFLDPYYQRWTQVDPEAKNATAQEIGYAALIGGISGVLLGGMGESYSAIRSASRGSQIVNSGNAETVVDIAKEFSQYQDENSTNIEAYQYMQGLVSQYESLSIKNTSDKPTLKQRQLLAEMERTNTVLTVAPAVAESKAKILADTKGFSDYLNSLKIEMDDGSIFSITPEELANNDAILTRYAVSDALGHILMDSKSVYDLTMQGDTDTLQNKWIGGQQAFLRFKEGASDIEIKQISSLLGVDINTITYEQYIERLKALPSSSFESHRDALYTIKTTQQAIGEAKVRHTEVEEISRRAKLHDGINLFKDSDGKIFAIIKSGKDLQLYMDGKITKKLDKKALNGLIFGDTKKETEKKPKKPKETAKPESGTVVSDERKVGEADITEERENKTDERAEKKETETPKAPKKPVAPKKPKETAKPENIKKAKTTSTFEARRRLVQLSMRKTAAVHGAYTQNGKQVVTDGYFIVVFDETVDGLTQNEGNKPNAETIIQRYRISDSKLAVNVDGFELKKAVPSKQTDEKAYIAHIGAGYFQTKMTSLVLDAIDDPVCYVGNDKCLYIKGSNGEAIVLGMRYSDNNEVGDKLKYEAKYVNNHSETQKKVKAETEKEREKENKRRLDFEKQEAEKAKEREASKKAETVELETKKKENIEEIAYSEQALIAGERISNAKIQVYDSDSDMVGEDKHLILALFDKHGIDVPIRTRGWISENLAYAKYLGGENSTWQLKIKKGAYKSKSIVPLMEKLYRAIREKSTIYTDLDLKSDLTSESTDARIFANLVKNGVFGDERDILKIDETPISKFLGNNDAHDYARQQAYSAESLAQAITEYADDIRAGKQVVLQVMERAFEIDGKTIPEWYRRQYHPTADEIAEDKKSDARYKKSIDDYKKALADKAEKKKNESEKQAEPKATEKIDDFGEKIGGARKDEWISRGLRATDLTDMNEREAAKYVKRDNIWKKPDYVQLVKDGGNRALLYAQNEIRKAIKPNIDYFNYTTEESRVAVRKLYIDTIAEIQSMAEKATSAQDFENMNKKWLLEKGYLKEENGRFSWTGAVYSNPVFCNGGYTVYYDTLRRIASNFNSLSRLAERAQFGVSAEEKIPAGYDIHQDSSFSGYKGTDKYYITKGYSIIGKDYATREEAFTALKSIVANKGKTDGKQRYTPPQLADIHREGYDYRGNNTKDVTGDDYISEFGFKGGEFGNWVSDKERQVCLNYGYDALMDLADALGISKNGISYGGELSIAFGSRGKGGASSAAAHYEPLRKVINLTKMSGAGCLAHEWWHGLDDYLARKIGVDGTTFATENNKYYKSPTKVQTAITNLVDAIKYRPETEAEAAKRLEKTKQSDLLRINRYLSDWFRWFEHGANAENISNYGLKTAPTAADISKYNELKDKVISTGDTKYVTELDEFHKKVYGRQIPRGKGSTYSFSDYDMFVFTLKGLSRYAETDIKLGRSNTEYYAGSQKMDKIWAKNGFGYWASEVEMSARAFDCYIADKTNKSSDYLSAHSDSFVGLDPSTNENVYAFPRGEERIRINKAFDELFSVLKEEGILQADQSTKPTNKARYALSEGSLNNENSQMKLLPRVKKEQADSFARKHIKKYDDLSEGSKLEVRWTIASGKMYGVDDNTIIALAKLSADSGISMGFANVTGDGVCYTVGGDTTIYLNSKGERTIETATLHELVHAMKGVKGYEYLAAAAEKYYNSNKDEANAIRERYVKFYNDNGMPFTDSILQDELTAAYIEKRLKNRNVLSDITAEEPTFMQKCINRIKNIKGFFVGDAADELQLLQNRFTSVYNMRKNKMAQDISAIVTDNKVLKDSGIRLALPIDKYPYNQQKVLKEYIRNSDEKSTTDVKKSIRQAVDSEGNTLSEQQAEFFKDSKVVDKDGNLLVCYHATPNKNFYVFKQDKIGKNSKESFSQGGALGRGFYFSDEQSLYYEWADWVNQQTGKPAQAMEVYLDIKNPLYYGNELDEKFLRVLESIVEKNNDEYQMQSLSGKKTNYELIDFCKDWDIDIQDTAKTAEYDGIIEDSYQMVVFDSNQIKLTTNKNPTSNSDIRYAIPTDDSPIDLSEIAGASLILTEMPTDRVALRDIVTGGKNVDTLKEQVKGDTKRFTEGWQIMATNAQAGLERVIKSSGMANAMAMTNYVRASRYAGFNAIHPDGGQYSLDGETRLGDSLTKILAPIYKGDKLGKRFTKNAEGNAKYAKYKDYQAKFELYLAHYHNIDRYAQGKMVLGEDITPIESQKIVSQFEETYPEFKKIAEKTWKFTDNLLEICVDSGMYSQEYIDTLREMYPHYVPTFRADHNNGVKAIQGKGNIQINDGKKSAVGADTQILPMDDMIAKMVIQRYSSARINKLLVDMANAFETSGKHSDEFVIISSETADLDIDAGSMVETKKIGDGKYQVSFYYNGKRVTAEVSKAVYSGIEAFAPSGDISFNNVLLDGISKVNTGFKKLVTSWNPFFSFFRNPIRDIQEAGLYTRYPLRVFAKNYGVARREISTNGKYWQEAKAAGITSASVYDYEKGITIRDAKLAQKISQTLEYASNALEMAPRLAEYISAREAGLSVQEALLQAQDVTTNFGRGGTFAKKLNSTIMPFLNPAIQGFSKMVRAYTGKDAAQSWINLIIRSILLGIGLTALNDLLNGDDEDYKNLSDYIKENNYVIALGDGDFVKIPKGRVLGVIGGVYLRSKWYLEGDKNAFDGFLKNFATQVTPVDNFSRTIFSPISDLKNNTTWYGGTIESQKWANTQAKDRYDEGTSSISIWLGKVFNYSPIKIDYLLQQYGGVVADIALPATTLEAEKGIITQNMLANSVTNSKWSTKFYDTLEEYNYAKTSGDSTAKGVVKYLNSVKGTISDMNTQKRTIQADKSLSDSEKLTQVNIVQAAINALEKDALENVKYLENELSKYDLSDDSFDSSWRDAVSVVIGEDFALRSYNSDVYTKATKLQKSGIGMGTFYDYYFDIKKLTSDTNSDGETISGSKKAKVVEYTWSLDMPDIQKLVLLMSNGYTITDNDIKGIKAKDAKIAVAKYIAKLDIPSADKIEIAEMCGYMVRNGKIVLK